MDSIRSQLRFFIDRAENSSLLFDVQLDLISRTSRFTLSYMVTVLRRGLTNEIDDATPTGMLACKPETGAHYR